MKIRTKCRAGGAAWNRNAAPARVRGGLSVRTAVKAGIKQKVTENPVGE